MKLNYKRTIFVGFAFFLICAFWQAYDNTIPLILTNKFGMSQTLSGGVMTLDNVLALFMLPLFGAISDKCQSKLGRRTPFILIGTILAAIFFVMLSFADMAQLKNIAKVATIDDPAALTEVYTYNEQTGTELQTPDGEKFVLSERFSSDEFLTIPSQLIFSSEAEVEMPNGETINVSKLLNKDVFETLPSHLLFPSDAEIIRNKDGTEATIKEAMKEDAREQRRVELILSSGALHAYTVSGGDAGTPYALTRSLTEKEQEDVVKHGTDKAFANPQYSNYVVPARQAYAWNVTKNSPLPLIFFMILLLIVLVSMAIFRSPAVALMPDVTIKPLRSKANAIINLMGSAGGIVVLGLGIVFATSSVKNSLMSYLPYFSVIAGIMLLALLVFRWQVDEPRFVAEMEAESRKFGIEDKEEDDSGDRKLSRPELRSLIFLLASIVLWFMGYNAITSKYSVYASNVLHKDYNLTLIIAQAAAILAYLPVGLLSSKLGRKKMILAGVVMLTTAFFIASFLRSSSPTLLMNAMFVLAGVGWATINVNSFPMVVEMSKGSDVGKYTGIYYTASMAAQTVTPWISGFCMDKFGMWTFFPYATIFAALAFVTMLFVKHGDNKPTAKTGLEALDVED